MWRLWVVCGVAVLAVVLPVSRPFALTVGALLLVVVIHEFGHFVAARAVGVGAPEFSVGFGPVVWSSSGRRLGTRFQLRAVPLGGFVRVKGMGSSPLESSLSESSQLEPVADGVSDSVSGGGCASDVSSDAVADGDGGVFDVLAAAPFGVPGGSVGAVRVLGGGRVVSDRSYGDVSHPRRVLIAVAGPLANVLSAFLLIVVVLMASGKWVPSGSVSPATGSPAFRAGVVAGDTIVAVDGVPASRALLRSAVEAAGVASEPVVLSLRSPAGLVRDVPVEPEFIDGVWRIGVVADVENVAVPVWEAVPSALSATGVLALTAVDSLNGVFEAVVAWPSAMVSGEVSDNRVLSPVGAARVAEHASDQQGWRGPLALLAAMSLFVALFNLLPFPPLDGAHAAIAVYEGVASRVRRRPVQVDPLVLRPVTAIVVAGLLALAVGSVLLDVFRPIALP